jgi:hypothetical protein
MVKKNLSNIFILHILTIPITYVLSYLLIIFHSKFLKPCLLYDYYIIILYILLYYI